MPGDPAVGVGAETREELRDQARLARARLAHHAHHLRAALPHRRERGHELRELGIAAHQRRRQPQRGQPPGRSRLRQRAQHAMHHDGLGLALGRYRARGLEGKGVLGEPIRGLGHQDGPGLRRRQQPRGRVHGIARHRVGRLRAPAEATRHHRPRVKADVERHRLAEPPLPLPAERRGALQHVQRRPHRPLRVVLVGHRRAEHRHDRVAHELLHEAVIARDRLGQRVEERGLEGAHHLGVEPLGQRGEAGQIGEEDGDLAAVGLAGWGRWGRVAGGRGDGGRGRGGRLRLAGGGQPLPAARAKREFWRSFEAAAGADHGSGRLR